MGSGGGGAGRIRWRHGAGRIQWRHGFSRIRWRRREDMSRVSRQGQWPSMRARREVSGGRESLAYQSRALLQNEALVDAQNHQKPRLFLLPGAKGPFSTGS